MSLEKKELNGYKLIKNIEYCEDKKISSGTIYPLLNRMQEEGLITKKQKGRSNIYSLTKKGKKEFNNHQEDKKYFFNRMIKFYTLFAKNNTELNFVKRNMNSLLAEKTLSENLSLDLKLKKTLFKIMSSKDFDKKQIELKKNS